MDQKTHVMDGGQHQRMELYLGVLHKILEGTGTFR